MIKSARMASATIVAASIAVALLAVRMAAAQNPDSGTIIVSPVPMQHAVLPGQTPADGSVVVPQAAADEPTLPVRGHTLGGLVINATFDASITSDPNATAIEAAINTAIANIESQFSDPITVNITFQEGGGLGSSSTFFGSTSYATFLAALKTDAKTSDDATAIALLPNVSTNPVNGATTINLKTANFRALGFNVNPPVGEPDGFIALNTTITSPGSPGSTGTYNLLPVVEHEIDEVLGLGSALPSVPGGTIFPEDLYRYSAVNTRSFTTTNSVAFFSINGTTSLAQFDNQNDGGDFGDWQSNPLPGGVSPKVQDAFATPGANPTLSAELNALDVIGYDRVTRKAVSDFNGDGRSDPGIFRPTVLPNALWYSTPSGGGSPFQIFFGASGDIPVVGDYDGDGKADAVIWRPSTGLWYGPRTGAAQIVIQTMLGQMGDIPVPCDYDGDGKIDPAIYRPSTGLWFGTNAAGNTVVINTNLGLVAGDIPVPADYNGDGKCDPAIMRPGVGPGGTNLWYSVPSGGGAAFQIYFGAAGDIPAPGDYDGDGKADAVIFRPSTGLWYGPRTGAAQIVTQIILGQNGDIPIQGDYDGNGAVDPAIYRPSTGLFYGVNAAGTTVVLNTNIGQAAGDNPTGQRPHYTSSYPF